jgi:hypothetical protein
VQAQSNLFAAIEHGPDAGPNTEEGIFMFTPDGVKIAIATLETSAGDIAIDSGGNIYSCNELEKRICKITSEGITTFYQFYDDRVYFNGLAVREEREPPKLFVTIPGINDDGTIMLANVEFSNKVSYDSECEVIIREVSGLSDQQVLQLVTEAAAKANEKGKDVIVNIDMDLEGYTMEFVLPPLANRWSKSVKWAGKIANLVSDAFTKEVPDSTRMLIAHSAGGDATYQSISQARQPKYDNINILNGRTAVDNLRRALRGSGYSYQQIKVFTCKDDLPATPPPPKLLKLWSGSISNYDAAREWAGKAWIHLHCSEIAGHEKLGHSELRDHILGPEGTFDVSLGSSGSWNEVGTVEEMMLKDW